MRKNTRATLGGLMIAAASLWALAMAYDEARDNLLRFFFTMIILLLLIAGFAIIIVAIFYGVKKIFRHLVARDDEDQEL